ncbi:MAG: hypothetical protein H8D67_13375 [Deltaproteobacteria bacterium]|nr:hypothetical protein [Deltaproteobacteria bacterium]
MKKAGKKSFVRKMVTKIFRRTSGKIESRKRKRGRPLKGISDLTERQREILLKPNLTCREKAAELNMSVGWVAKWGECLRQEVMKETLSGLFTRRLQARSQK